MASVIPTAEEFSPFTWKCCLTCLVNVIHLLKLMEEPNLSEFNLAVYEYTFLRLTIEEYVYAAAAARASALEAAVV